MRDEVLFQLHPGVVTADRDTTDLRRGNEVCRERRVRGPFCDDRNPPSGERVAREWRHQASGRELHRGADIQHASIRLGDDLELSHASEPPVTIPMNSRLRYFSA